MTEEEDFEKLVQDELDALESDVSNLSDVETLSTDEVAIKNDPEADSKPVQIPEYETLTNYQKELKLKRKAFQSQLDSCHQLLTAADG